MYVPTYKKPAQIAYYPRKEKDNLDLLDYHL